VPWVARMSTMHWMCLSARWPSPDCSQARV
jgi:hypothetical protein